MKVIKKPFEETVTAKRIFDSYFEDFSFAVFDIETTGFYPANDNLILSGFITAIDNKLELVQFFSEQPRDEKAILEESINLINSVDFVITYNGRFFDVPFIKKRAKKYGLAFPDLFNLDLFILFKHYSELPKFLPSLSQKSLEEFSGIAQFRADKIDGGESVALYQQYLNTHSAELEEKILLHNSDDVMQLYRLLALLKHTELHRALTRHGFPISGGRIKDISFKNQELIIRGTTQKAMDYITFPTPDSPYSFRMNGSDGSFDFALPCDKDKGITYLDAQAVLGDRMSALEEYPGFSNGYLIIKDQKEVNYAEINYFAKTMVPLVFEKLGIWR